MKPNIIVDKESFLKKKEPSICALYGQNTYVTNRTNDEFVQSSWNTKFADINGLFSFHDKYALVDATKAPFFSHFHGFFWSEKFIEIEIF